MRCRHSSAEAQGAGILKADSKQVGGTGKSGGGGLQGVFLNASLELDAWGRARHGHAAARTR